MIYGVSKIFFVTMTSPCAVLYQGCEVEMENFSYVTCKCNKLGIKKIFEDYYQQITSKFQG